MNVTPSAIRGVEDELQRLRALLTEATQTKAIKEEQHQGYIQCFHCNHLWHTATSYEDAVEADEQHYGECWVERARAALAAATDEQEAPTDG